MPYSLCGTSVANLGEQGCDKARGVIKKIFIFNGAIAAADYISEAAFLAKMIENSKLSKNASNKVFVLNEIQDIADASEANKTGSLNQGFTATLLEGKPGYTIKTFAGSDLNKRLRKWNNQNIGVVEYDANGVFWVVEKSSTAKGFQAKAFTTGNKAATGQNVEEGVSTTNVSFLSTSEYYDNCKWIECDGNVEDIVPLLDVALTYVSNVANVVKYSMKVPGSILTGPYSVGPEVGALIAALLADFSAKSGAGTPTTPLAITSIAYDSTNDLLTVTYDSTAYTAATGNIMLVAPTPAELDLGDVTETELLSVTHVKPA